MGNLHKKSYSYTILLKGFDESGYIKIFYQYNYLDEDKKKFFNNNL